jgi:hypothetical protein
MQKKPNLIFRFVQFTDFVKERDYIATIRAKREYVSSANPNTDSTKLDRLVTTLSSTDKNFLAYLRIREPLVDSLGVEAVCGRLYNSSEIITELNSIIAKRNSMVRNFLMNSQNIKPEMIEVSTADLNNIPDELKFPHFKIEVTIQ